MTSLITGASSGIGLELARVLAAQEHHLILVARSENRLNALKCELEQAHPITVTVLALDLSEVDAATRLHEEVVRRKLEVDILVNNAGVGDFGKFAETDWQKEAAMIQLNITALTQATKLFLPAMLKRGNGRIMNVASTAAFAPGPLMAVYFATKAFVLHFSEAISNELRGTGVTVTALCPGPTTSGFQAVASLEDSKLVKGKKLPTSREVAEFGYHAMMAGKPVAIHGLANKALTYSLRFAPRGLVTKVVRLVQEM